MKVINSRFHGIIDYLVVVFLVLSPTIFGLPELAATFAYILAGVHLLLTVLTSFEFGVIKLISFKLHGVIELIVSFALVGLAFYLGAEEGGLARNFYIGFAVAVFLTWLLTNYRSA
ncbi:hypothetical protein [Christiangramia forsetii]|uniref:Uncharacterized protein n=2 Tax=Christiangramia forsetii TaxID=411153 RepID=A0M6Y4_CHRFK|nr:hypothetical protein [Christiangramia forsetii]GGG29210.1 hypothetical protein GCM10011532_10840 [Christiangramia forsetii]CAL68379.1 conserved hypothetical protein, membrane [Christiangramia forsetii KT0803]